MILGVSGRLSFDYFSLSFDKYLLEFLKKIALSFGKKSLSFEQSVQKNPALKDAMGSQTTQSITLCLK